MTISKTAIQAVLLVLGLGAVFVLGLVIRQAFNPRSWERGSDGVGDGGGSVEGDGGGDGGGGGDGD